MIWNKAVHGIQLWRFPLQNAVIRTNIDHLKMGWIEKIIIRGLSRLHWKAISVGTNSFFMLSYGSEKWVTGKVKFWVGKTACVFSFACLYNFSFWRNKLSIKEESDTTQQQYRGRVHINLTLKLAWCVYCKVECIVLSSFQLGFWFSQKFKLLQSREFLHFFQRQRMWLQYHLDLIRGVGVFKLFSCKCLVFKLMDNPCLSFYNLHYRIWKAKVPPKIQV